MMGWKYELCSTSRTRDLPAGTPGHDLSGCRDNLVGLWRWRSGMVRQVPLAGDVTTALAEPDRNKALAVAPGAEDDLVTVF